MSVSFLGLQYIYNVGFGFSTLGDSNLETQQDLSNLCFVFLSLFTTIILGSQLSSQTFNNPLLSLASYIYSPKLVEKS